MYSTFQNNTIHIKGTLVLKYTNFETLGHLPETRWSAKSDRSAIMKKEELIEIIETLTDNQVEYLYHLVRQLFGKTSD